MRTDTVLARDGKRGWGSKTDDPHTPTVPLQDPRRKVGALDHSHLALEILHDIQEVIVDIWLILELELYRVQVAQRV